MAKHIHSLKAPLNYNIEYMGVTIVDRDDVPGFVGHVVADKEGGHTLIDPADDRNLSIALSFSGSKIVGRGVLVEQVHADEWLVAWRPYDAKPEVIPWTE